MTRRPLAAEAAARTAGDAMATLSTIVVVHAAAAPEARELMALCPDHLVLLQSGVPWAGLDEVVGASSVLPCEACVLLDHEVGVCRSRPGHAARVGSGGAVR